MLTPILCACEDLPGREFAPGEMLLPENGKSDTLFILKEGRVEILKEGFQIATENRPGSIFGEISVLLNSNHMASVRTLEPSQFYVVEKGKTFLMSHPELMMSLTQMIAERLTGVATFAVELNRDLQSRREHSEMAEHFFNQMVGRQSAIRELLKLSFAQHKESSIDSSDSKS